MAANLLNPACDTCNECEVCVCSVVQPAPTSCQCIKEDYGALFTASDVNVTVSGYIAMPGLNEGGTCVSDYVGPTAPSVNGTYLISCTSDICYWHSVYAGCTLPFSRYAHYFAVARLEYINADYIRVTLEYFAASLATSTTPYPTITTAACFSPYVALSGHHAIRTLKYEPTGTFKRWLYAIGGDCQASCNTEGTPVRACRSGYIANTSDVSTGTSGPLGGMSVTVSATGI